MEPRYWNRPVGWWSLVLGIATGLVMGLWSFDGPMATPSWIGEYADTSRRLIRLGHIAFIGLGILDILLANELTRSSLDPRRRLLASRLMVAGNLGLPVALFIAAAWRPFKYVMGVPAMCVFVAMVLAARGAVHD
jgi:amino acid transporter